MIRTQYASSPQVLPSPRKRKRILLDDADETALDYLPPPAKRAHTLEDGFSLMSITPSRADCRAQMRSWSPEIQSDAEDGSLPTLRTPQVEPPIVEMEGDETGLYLSENAGYCGAEMQDIDMKRSTWYEKDKDRIVILDLDSDDDDEPRSSPPRDFKISSALLSRLPKPVMDIPPPPPPSGQLVLYRPPPWQDVDGLEVRSRGVDDQDIFPVQESRGDRSEERERDSPDAILGSSEDDMEIEPL